MRGTVAVAHSLLPLLFVAQALNVYELFVRKDAPCFVNVPKYVFEEVTAIVGYLKSAR